MTLGGAVSHTGVHMSGGTPAPQTLTGTLYGAEARLSLWRLYLTGEYRQGWLAPDEGQAPDSRHLSARAAFGVRLLSWLAVEGGPLLERIGQPAGDQQLVRWRIGAVLGAPLITDLATGYVSFAGSVAGTGVEGVAMPAPSGGGEIGIIVAPEGSPVWARLTYRLDREHLSFSRSRSVETVLVTLGVSVPPTGDPR